MTLLGKTRAQEEPEDSHSASSGDENPPPYVIGDAAGQGINDSKASMASSDDDKGHHDYSLEELDPEAVWLDVVKAEKHGSQIIDRKSHTILYTLSKEKRFTNPTRHLFRGSVPQDPEQRPANVLPYATVQSSGRTILLRDNNTGQAEPTKYKRKDLFKMPKWYGIPSVFTVEDTEYRIRVPNMGWSGKVILTIANDTTKTPLCVFRPNRKLITEVRSSIEILPIAISTSSAPKPHALLQDGQPTKLLDMAIIAESVLRLYQQQQNNSAAAASAGASAAC